MPGMTVLNGVDQRRRMFDPQPHGKGLTLQGHASLGQHPVGISGTMPRGQDQTVAGMFFPAIENSGPYPSFGRFESGQPGFEPNLHAPRQQRLPETDQHPAQNVGADVRPCLGQNLLGRPEIDQRLQNQTDPWVVEPGGQLAVGEGSRAPFAELDVAQSDRMRPPAQKRRTSPTRFSTGRPRSTSVTATP